MSMRKTANSTELDHSGNNILFAQNFLQPNFSKNQNRSKFFNSHKFNVPFKGSIKIWERVNGIMIVLSILLKFSRSVPLPNSLVFLLCIFKSGLKHSITSVHSFGK